MSALLITDTTALIALDRVDRLSLLEALYAPVVAPPAVLREFGRRPPWIEERAPEDRDAVERLRRELDAGEAEAIALAAQIPGAVLLIDEARGRRVAVGLGLDIIGTAGVLLVAKRAGLVLEVRPLLDTLRARYAFRLSDDLYAWALREAGEA